MPTPIDIGTAASGARAPIELEELLASRLLVQGNSGSGKSHLLRRLLEQSAGLVQQVVVDPEGDFASLGAKYGHLVIDAVDYAEPEIVAIAARVREQRVSVVLNLEGVDVDAQLRTAGTFLNRLFEAPREQWYPVLVVVDEAQLFAPAAAGDVGEEARRVSLGAMTNLMCRGRKRGLAGVIATQRLAKLAKNVAAEASNFLMGRTFLDIDMARAADLLGMERRQAEQIRDLERGQFLALGPALYRRPEMIRIGDVTTGSRTVAPALAPLPSFTADDHQQLLLDVLEKPAPPPPPPVRIVEPVEHLLARIDATPAETPDPGHAPANDIDAEAVIEAALREIVADEDAAMRPPASLHQDFAMRCRMRGLPRPPMDAGQFARALAAARAGLYPADMRDESWAPAVRIAGAVPEDMLSVFLLIARLAREEAPCPTDAEIARIYGTASLGRAKRLLGYMEQKGYVAFRTDLRGRRSAAIPELGWTTAPEQPEGRAA